MYLLCPICGNDTIINPKFESHRCKFCKTSLELKRTKRRKNSNKTIYELIEKQKGLDNKNIIE